MGFVDIRLRLYPFLHRFMCSGNLKVLVPTEEYMRESGDNEAYMFCDECGRKYHLVNLEPDDEFETKLAAIPEVEPDEWDRKMLAEIDAETDNSTVSLEEVRAKRELHDEY